MLSDEAKLEELKENITGVESSERNGLLMAPTVVFLLCVVFDFQWYRKQRYCPFWRHICFSTGDFISSLLGFYVAIYYAFQYNDLLNEPE